jgi:hypothetical protein
MCPQGSMQLLPEMSNELGTSVRNDGLRHTMQAHDARNKQFSILLSPVAGVHRMKWADLVSRLTITQMELNLWPMRGKHTMKSILMSSHF